MTYLSPLAYLLGLEGAALLRGLREGTGDEAFVDARVTEIRTLLADPALTAAGEVYRGWAALPVGFQVRHCAEPHGARRRPVSTRSAGVPVVVPGSSAPEVDWDLPGWVPEATALATDVPAIVIWHFQLDG